MIIENFCRPVSWNMNRILALRKILRKANLIFTLVKKNTNEILDKSLLFAEIGSEQEGFRELGRTRKAG